MLLWMAQAQRQLCHCKCGKNSSLLEVSHRHCTIWLPLKNHLCIESWISLSNLCQLYAQGLHQTNKQVRFKNILHLRPSMAKTFWHLLPQNHPIYVHILLLNPLWALSIFENAQSMLSHPLCNSSGIKSIFQNCQLLNE